MPKCACGCNKNVDTSTRKPDRWGPGSGTVLKSEWHISRYRAKTGKAQKK